jgi:hypothetical protein
MSAGAPVSDKHNLPPYSPAHRAGDYQPGYIARHTMKGKIMQSENIQELAAALSAAQAEMPAVKFNSTNPFLKNKYADLGAVIEAAKPVLAKHGLAVSQLVTGDGASIGVQTVLMHKSGQWMQAVVSLPLGDEKGKSQAQFAGSVITYLRRYSYASMLGMYADEDGDGNAAPQKPAANQSTAPVINYEQACEVLNSEGHRYGDIDTETLSHISNNAKAPAEKRAAAAAIINFRNALKG